ncbi:MAG: RNA methyltransferase [Bacteroidetes bacterium]|nr:RNA methyltransferase [Bacteroidota bacterium]
MIDLEESYPSILNKVNWNFDEVSNSALHSIHPYPAKFIPNIPRALISSLPIPAGSIILDPFCGSGVTLTEAQDAGIESLGVDLNPIACLLSKVKTNPLPTGFLTTAYDIAKDIKSFKGDVYIPAIPNLDHWFKKDVQRMLTLIIDSIGKLENQNLADALRFCVSSIIVKVSNQESDTRYAAINKAFSGNDVLAFFLQKVVRLNEVKRATSNNAESIVLNKDSLTLDQNDLTKPIGLVITSPPYPNAYEYWLYHKYRMWWLGFDPINVKNKEIGARAHYFKKNHQTEVDFILQMNKLFDFFSKNCIKDGFVAFIIGRSKIHGRIIENEKIIKEAGEKFGFVLTDSIERTINPFRKSFNLSHARIKQEYLVVMQKN